MALQEAIRFGILNGEPRMRVVAPGGSMQSPTFGDLVYDSSLSVLKLRQHGAVTFTSVGQQRDIAYPDSGYVPFVLAALTAQVAFAYYGSLANPYPADWFKDGILESYYYVGPGNPVVMNPKSVMPYMMYDQGTRGGYYERGFFQVNAQRTFARITNYLKPNGTYTAYYYVFDLPIS